MSADIWEAFGSSAKPLRKKEPNHIIDEPTYSTSYVEPSQDVHLRGLRSKEPVWRTDGGAVDVLFDASEDDLDDFGDFEDAAPKEGQVKPPQITTSVGVNRFDLLGLEDPGSDDRDPNDRKNTLASPLPVNPYPGGLPIVQTTAQPSLHIQNHKDDDEQWGVFEDAESEAPAVIQSSGVSQPKSTQDGNIKDLDDDWDTFEDSLGAGTPAPVPDNGRVAPAVAEKPNSGLKVVSRGQERPINIPPPFSLLQIIPRIYSDLTRAPAENQEDQAITVTIAQRILEVYCVTARIIAGRSQRWKRDVHLSQSMRISQAGVKSSGMKLTSLDRGEAIREDQQVLEVIAAWAQNAHRLNAILGKAKRKKPPIQLSSNMNIRGASGAGVLMAKDVCPVCGLKRNERVLGIDVNIQDAFDEFWIEHWGHRDCHDFWYTSQDLLDHR